MFKELESIEVKQMEYDYQTQKKVKTPMNFLNFIRQLETKK